MTRSVVRVVGWDEWRRDVRRAGPEARNLLAAQLRDVARRIVPRVLARYDATVGSWATGRLRGTIRARGSAQGAQIAMGTARTPYASWWEFGGSTRSPIWGRGRRAVVKGGRTVYPAIAESTDDIGDAVRSVLRLMRERVGRP